MKRSRRRRIVSNEDDSDSDNEFSASAPVASSKGSKGGFSTEPSSSADSLATQPPAGFVFDEENDVDGDGSDEDLLATLSQREFKFDENEVDEDDDDEYDLGGEDEEATQKLDYSEYNDREDDKTSKKRKRRTYSDDDDDDEDNMYISKTPSSIDSSATQPPPGFVFDEENDVDEGNEDDDGSITTLSQREFKFDENEVDGDDDDEYDLGGEDEEATQKLDYSEYNDREDDKSSKKRKRMKYDDDDDDDDKEDEEATQRIDADKKSKTKTKDKKRKRMKYNDDDEKEEDNEYVTKTPSSTQDTQRQKAFVFDEENGVDEDNEDNDGSITTLSQREFKFDDNEVDDGYDDKNYDLDDEDDEATQKIEEEEEEEKEDRKSKRKGKKRKRMKYNDDDEKEEDNEYVTKTPSSTQDTQRQKAFVFDEENGVDEGNEDNDGEEDDIDFFLGVEKKESEKGKDDRDQVSKMLPPDALAALPPGEVRLTGKKVDSGGDYQNLDFGFDESKKKKASKPKKVVYSDGDDDKDEDYVDTDGNEGDYEDDDYKMEDDAGDDEAASGTGDANVVKERKFEYKYNYGDNCDEFNVDNYDDDESSRHAKIDDDDFLRQRLRDYDDPEDVLSYFSEGMSFDPLSNAVGFDCSLGWPIFRTMDAFVEANPQFVGGGEGLICEEDFDPNEISEEEKVTNGNEVVARVPTAMDYFYMNLSKIKEASETEHRSKLMKSYYNVDFVPKINKINDDDDDVGDKKSEKEKKGSVDNDSENGQKRGGKTRRAGSVELQSLVREIWNQVIEENIEKFGPESVPVLTDDVKHEIAGKAEKVVEQVIEAMLRKVKKNARKKKDKARTSILLERFLTDRRVSPEFVFRAASEKLTMPTLSAAYRDWMMQMKALDELKGDFLNKATRTHADHLEEDEGATSSLSAEYLGRYKSSSHIASATRGLDRRLPLKKMPAAMRAAAEAAAAEKEAQEKARRKTIKSMTVEQLEGRLMKDEEEGVERERRRRRKRRRKREKRDKLLGKYGKMMKKKRKEVNENENKEVKEVKDITKDENINKDNDI